MSPALKLAKGKRAQRLVVLVSVLSLFILWVYSNYLVTPLMRQARELGAQVSTARSDLDMLERVLANEEALRRQHEELEQTVASLRHVLPGEEALPSIMELLSELASQSQVRIQTIFPQRGVAETGLTTGPGSAKPEQPVYVTVPIEIDALAGYHELGVFLSLIEAGSTPVELDTLRLSSNAKEMRRHTIKLVIRAYFATATPVSSAARATSPRAS